MWNDTVTLYIDDTSIRLLVCNGPRIKKWADVQLEPGLIKDSIVLQEDEVAGRIKKLFKEQKVDNKKIILGFNGLHSLTRPATLPQLPKAMLHEAVAREARRVLPVPLDQVYLSWRNIPCPKGRIQIFLAATPRKTVDSLMKALHNASLRPYRMTIKPLALTKALPVNSAIMIDLQATEFDIVIMVDGIAQPIRTVNLPAEETTREQKLNMIINDLDRTIKFFDTNNPEKPLPANVPIYVSGALMGKTELLKTLSDATGRPVTVLSPTIKGSEKFDMGRYMVNISMALRPPSMAREATFPIANLNLLPAPYQPKPISLAKVIAIPAGIALIGVIVPLVMSIQSTAAEIKSIQNQIDATNQLINQKNTERQGLKNDIAGLEKQATAVKTSRDNLEKSIQTLNVQHDYVNGDILIALSKLPTTINLTGISQSSDKLVLTGTASTEDEVYSYVNYILQYARTLDASERYTECTVSALSLAQSSGTTTEGGPTIQNTAIQFTLTFDRGG